MGHTVGCLCLALGLLASSSVAAAQAPADAEVAKGIRAVEDGDYDRAIVILDAASRRLAAQGTSRDLGDAYLYLGIAYLAKGHDTSAKARFREALAQIRDLKLSADKFAPKVIEVFEVAREEMAKALPAFATPAPAEKPAAAPLAPKKGGSKKGLILVGAGVAAAAGVGVAAGGGSSSDGPGTSSFSYRIDAADVQALPSHGPGGFSNYQVQCPFGSLAVGITGQASSSYLVRIGTVCAVLQPDGTVGADVITNPAGGGGTASSFTERCPAGHVIGGVYGSTNPVGIQGFGIRCAPLPDWVGGAGAVANLTLHGGTGGAVFAETCSPSYVVDRFSGDASSTAITKIVATCVRVRR